MLDNGIVEQSNSEFSSPPVLVRKKDGTVRFCIDYRKLNDLTVQDSYRLPRISEALDSIGSDAKYFSLLYLAMGYHRSDRSGGQAQNSVSLTIRFPSVHGNALRLDERHGNVSAFNGTSS